MHTEPLPPQSTTCRPSLGSRLLQNALLSNTTSFPQGGFSAVCATIAINTTVRSAVCTVSVLTYQSKGGSGLSFKGGSVWCPAVAPWKQLPGCSRRHWFRGMLRACWVPSLYASAAAVSPHSGAMLPRPGRGCRRDAVHPVCGHDAQLLLPGCGKCQWQGVSLAGQARQGRCMQELGSGYPGHSLRASARLLLHGIALVRRGIAQVLLQRGLFALCPSSTLDGLPPSMCPPACMPSPMAPQLAAQNAELATAPRQGWAHASILISHGHACLRLVSGAVDARGFGGSFPDCASLRLGGHD